MHCHLKRNKKIPQLKPLTVLVHLTETEQQLCFYYCNPMSKSEFIFDDWEHNKRQSSLMASELCFGGPNVFKRMIQSWCRFIRSKWSHGDWSFRTSACITGHHKPICQSQPADELLHWKAKQARLESNTLIWLAAVQQALKYVLSESWVWLINCYLKHNLHENNFHYEKPPFQPPNQVT